MSNTSFETIKVGVLQKLKGLDVHLVYHNIDHTLDVLKHAERIASEENIIDEHQLYLLKIAALYHDVGFLRTYDGHEEESCDIFLTDAAEFELTEADKSLVQKLIMATKLTNKPQTLLEKILSDADLDYLGRHDFHEISTRLKLELLQVGIIADGNEWEKRQLAFLKQHHYHTPSSIRLREPVKKENYSALLA